MSQNSINISPTSASSGFAKIDLWTTAGGNNRQAIVIADPTNDANVAPVDPVYGLKVDIGRAVAITIAAGSAAIGTVGVSSLPALPTGANNIGSVTISGTPTVAISGTVPVSGTFYLATQPVSIATLPALATGANTIGAVTQSGTWNIGSVTTLPALAAGSAVIGSVKLTDGTNFAPVGDTVARAGFEKITDGTNSIVIKAASTAATATDASLVVAHSPNSPTPSGTNTIGSVKMTDGTSTAALAPASTAAAASQSAIVVGLSPNSPLPAGTNNIGYVYLGGGSAIGITTVTKGTTAVGSVTSANVDANTQALHVMNSGLGYGEDPVAGLQVVENRYQSTFFNAAGTTSFAAAFIDRVIISGGTAGEVKVYDNASAASGKVVVDFDSTMPLGSHTVESVLTLGCTIVLSAATKVTVIWR